MKRNTYDIIGVGSPLIDLIIHVSEEDLLALDAEKASMHFIDHSTLTATLAKFHNLPIILVGGSATNVIQGLAHLGQNCALIGNIGKDAAAEQLLKTLQEINIQPLYTRSDTSTGQVLCLVTPDGERTFQVFRGASCEINSDLIQTKTFEGTTLVHIEGYSLTQKNLTERCMKCAKDAGALISFDLANFEIIRSYKDEIIDLLKTYVDIVFANVSEAATLLYLPPKEAAMRLSELCHTAIVTMHTEGCWIAQESYLFHCPAFPVTPLDTTGAGDLFASGFLNSFLLHKPLITCARNGALIAAEVVKVHGSSLSEATWLKLKKSIN